MTSLDAGVDERVGSVCATGHVASKVGVGWCGQVLQTPAVQALPSSFAAAGVGVPVAPTCRPIGITACGAGACRFKASHAGATRSASVPQCWAQPRHALNRGVGACGLAATSAQFPERAQRKPRLGEEFAGSAELRAPARIAVASPL